MKKRKSGSGLRKFLLAALDIGINLVIVFILVAAVQKWLIAPFDVSGASMCDTLNLIDGKCVNDYGEKIILNEAVYLFNDPKRGDIVVFKPEGEEKYFIKRVIGLPGETVEIKDGNIYVTDPKTGKVEKLQENYLNEKNKGKTHAYFSDFSTFNVPKDKYFVLGDNRMASTDSRSCFMSSLSESCKNQPEKAFAKRESIRGKAWLIFWPINNIETLKTPNY